ncbi:hypothetical protein [Bacillus sp. FJAT-27225]|uniref:hypothetical protein n=1 Tax=Bacillus sp. FJAT-27225 TaxID=1743144 RepID=UPI000AD923CD|nr:hypothetical protein [Bacillus sp. FJAT-27225]
MLFKVRYLGKTSLSLTNGNIYDVISKDAFDWWRIIDESGEDYCYSLDEFEIIES